MRTVNKLHVDRPRVPPYLRVATGSVVPWSDVPRTDSRGLNPPGLTSTLASSSTTRLLSTSSCSPSALKGAGVSIQPLPVRPGLTDLPPPRQPEHTPQGHIVVPDSVALVVSRSVPDGNMTQSHVSCPDGLVATAMADEVHQGDDYLNIIPGLQS